MQSVICSLLSAVCGLQMSDTAISPEFQFCIGWGGGGGEATEF